MTPDDALQFIPSGFRISLLWMPDEQVWYATITNVEDGWSTMYADGKGSNSSEALEDVLANFPHYSVQ